MALVAWVTGVSGFLGRHAARRLARAGWTVVGLSRRDIDTAADRGLSHALSGSLEHSLPRAAAIGGPPGLVVHAAGAGSVGATAAAPEEGFEATVGTTAILLDYLRREAPGACLLYPSSAAVYGDNDGRPLAEDRPPAPVSEYGRHKLRAEFLLGEARERHGLSCTAVRFFSIYGPDLRKQVLWDWGRRLLAGESPLTASGSGDEVRDFLHVDDAIDLLLSLVRLPPERRPALVNGGTGRPTPMRRLATLLAEALGRPDATVFDGKPRPGDPVCYLADTKRLSACGFAPAVSLEEGVRRYAEWMIRSSADR